VVVEAHRLPIDILRALGHEHATIEPIGLGLASQAWLVRLDGSVAVLRTGIGEADSEATYEMEHALMARLHELGAPVPRPLTGHWLLQGWTGAPFSLTSFVPGVQLRLDGMDRAVPAVSTFLQSLATLRVPGYGPLVVVDGELRGSEDDVEAGLRAWAEWRLWPLDAAWLEDHVALRERPDLVVRLDAYAARVRAALLDGATALLHADLHEENLLDADGVVSILDFGQALVGPLAWEYASIAYFAGWPVADAVLNASADRDANAMRHDASLIALAFGVHRWWQDRERGVDGDEYDQAFLDETLSRVTTVSGEGSPASMRTS
jgi:hypothetical protein